MTHQEAVLVLRKARAYRAGFERFTLEQVTAMIARLATAAQLVHGADSRWHLQQSATFRRLVQRKLALLEADEASTEGRARWAWEDEQLDRLYGGW